MGVNTSGNVVMPVQPGQGTGLSFGALGADDSGRNVYGLQFTNTGSVTLDYGSGSGKNAYGASATVNNSTPILVNFTGLTIPPRTAAWAATAACSIPRARSTDRKRDVEGMCGAVRVGRGGCRCIKKKKKKKQ